MIGGATIAAFAIAAYASAFSGAFVFLDQSAIRDNPTIRHLSNLGQVLRPPAEGGLTVGGRPLVNLSFAFNYALSGLNPWSYHAANLLIHIGAGLALFGIVRRTARALGWGRADLFGWAAAVLWTVHPLQTESVTYVVQRAESLMGLFYLLTLYCFVRATAAGASRRAGWLALSWACCLLGMAAKEVMVSAPVMVFLYDRAFVAGSFREAWARRRGYYLWLAGTWILLGALVLSTGGSRGGTSGFALPIGWGAYLLTQGPAILHYLGLAFWPHPLVIYHTPAWVHGPSAWAQLVLVALLASVALAAFIRNSPWGYLGAWFFAILAPTSILPGMSQTMAEHRMYLALAPVAVAAAAGIFALLPERKSAAAGVAAAVVVLAAVLASLTALRNRAYRSELALWTDTVANAPDNPYAQNNLGTALADAGRFPEAAAHFARAVALAPDYAEAQDNLGLALAGEGRLAEAVKHYERAIALKRDMPETQTNWGVALAGLGRWSEAISRFRRAVALDPSYAPAHNDLAAALAHTGRLTEAVEEYRQAARLMPGHPEVHANEADALAHLGRWQEALGEYEAALQLRPDDPDVNANLGAVLAQLGRLPEAVKQYERALALAPKDPDVLYNLALAQRALGQSAEAEANFALAQRLREAR